jgi:hypothetical protein
MCDVTTFADPAGYHVINPVGQARPDMQPGRAERWKVPAMARRPQADTVPVVAVRPRHHVSPAVRSRAFHDVTASYRTETVR